MKPPSPDRSAPTCPPEHEPEPDPFPPLPRAHHRVTCAARSDRGQERPENQDRVALLDARTQRAWGAPSAASLATAPGALVAVVCDGMGGEAGGAVASHLAVDTLVAALSRDLAAPLAAGPDGDSRVARALIAAVDAAGARVRLVARAEPRYARMGTTATVAALAERALVCAQVGDSRAYVLRAGRLVQVTRDQTMLELLRESGVTPRGEDGEPIGANVILQAVGSSPRLDVVVTRTPVESGDLILLCSDGLHGVVPHAEIERTLDGEPDLERAADALVDAANAAGGPDNVSCVLLRVERDARSSAPREVETVRLSLGSRRA